MAKSNVSIKDMELDIYYLSAALKVTPPLVTYPKVPMPLFPCNVTDTFSVQKI
ncbi:hypothetical protein RHGRI_031783 [Rhododendron griersonianum]|uniref:Uncharacterized protein n=1 Tax=Rhododendron griersonianum TaxID=479676 RepID=A0AAV6I991_9ERIC|nr:hypothetical protein RHGRI_031783 [Rhododendron griersonianum]